MRSRTARKKLCDRRRRSKRLALDIPVLVCGRAADNSYFRESTRTLTVNAYGGLLTLCAPVVMEQSVLLENKRTHEVSECRVAYVGREQDDKKQIGVEFIHPAPNFWRIQFPIVEPRVSMLVCPQPLPEGPPPAKDESLV
jgi:hypothetical protein